jgi:hypothetical protein
MSKCHIKKRYIGNFMYISCYFKAQKSQFSGPTPSNGPRNGFVRVRGGLAVSTPWPTVFCYSLIRVLTPSLSSAGTSGYGFPLPSLSVFLPIFLLSYYFNGLLFILEIPLPDKCYIHGSAFKPRSSVIFPVLTKQPFSASNFDIYNILTASKKRRCLNCPFLKARLLGSVGEMTY